MTRRSLSLMLGAVPFLQAADPWKAKKAADWSAADIQKLTTNSPWAKEATSTSAAQPTLGNRIPSVDSSSAGATGLPPVDREALNGATQFRIKLRWESAQSLIDSGKRKRSKQAELYYIVSASGLPVLEPHEEPKDAALEGQAAIEAQNRRKPITVRLKENTTLERKGKDPIYPERVELIEGSGMRVPIFLFLREGNPIVLEDKDVVFHTKFRSEDFKAKFVLKDMVYDGKLEL